MAAVLAGCGGGTDSERENGLIAFVIGSQAGYHAYVVEPDGTGRRPLTGQALNEECPRWSPDGKRVALAAYETSGSVVTDSWLQVVDAGGELEWSRRAAPTRCPQWSPDGDRIAFVSGSSVTVVDAAGGEPRRLADDVAQLRDLVWSPDGRELAYVPSGHDDTGAGDLEIAVLDVDTGGRRRVSVSGAGACREGSGFDPRVRFVGGQALAWAPGKEILFALEAEEVACGGINAVSPDGTGERRVTRGGGVALEPSWSPDGTHIAFSGSGGSGLAQGADGETWVIEPDGTGVVNVSDNRAVDDYTPVWSPDGSMLAFLRAGAADTDRLYVADAAGGAPLRLEDDVSVSGPSWQGVG
jgi:TolB protein